MCGIVGLHGRQEPSEVIERRLRKMCQAIIHRGPDDEGIMVLPGLGIGMRRLSIIDVAGGHQPISNEDHSIHVVFNGEIYNFKALRDRLESEGHQFRTHTDTEVIVHAYESEGVDCVRLFNGMFGFAIWDAPRRRLLLARDRMGIKPLYYMQTRLGLAFASEVKALLTLPEVERGIDRVAVAQFFRLGFVPAPDTAFRGIRKLPAGCRLVADEQGVRVEQYWDLEFEPRRPEWRLDECRGELRTLLQQVVADQMVADVPLGAFLSGGVDSTAVVAFMKQAATDVRTFSIGFDSEHAYHDETPFAERAARALGTRHETLIVRPQVAELMPALIEKLDEPLTDTSFINSFLVSEMARREVKVALSGLGGDEMFAGYRRYLFPMVQSAMAWVPNGMRRTIGGALDRRLSADRGSVLGNMARYAKALGRTLHLPPGEQYLGLLAVMSHEYLRELLPGGSDTADPGAELVALHDRAHTSAPLDRLTYVDVKTVLPESLLLLSDKMGMAASLEVRVPFLDNRVVDFVRSIPAEHRLRGVGLKGLLKSSLRGVVPEFVLNRSKRGFGMPIGTWLRTELRPMVQHYLGAQRIREAGIFNAGAVEKIVAAHHMRREDFTEPIVALLVFELWRDRFRLGVS
ncbi:MAG: asparagine synthase (glutamine-hydrolyzing) [Burkholderiales bacterium]